MGNAKLKMLLRRNKLSERRASRILGISPSLINRIAADGETPALRTASKIVAGFDGQIGYLDLLSASDRRDLKRIQGALVDTRPGS